MTNLIKIPTATFALAIRALVLTILLAAPVLAVPSMASGEGSIIEAPASGKSGVGFVLLVSLQRN